MQELGFTTLRTGTQPFRLADVGEGPAVVLLHGFPDTPHSWAATATALAAAGYRAVVPYLRGYHPDTVVEGRRYRATELGADVHALLDTLGIEQAVLVGHDWGASCVWSAAELAPARVTGLVAVAIPHPSRIRPTPSLAWGARHFVTLRLPGADRRLARFGARHVERFYRRWSPGWRGSARDATVAQARAALSDPVVADHAVRWYADLRPGAARPDPFPFPALLVAGADDLVDPEDFVGTRRLFVDPDGVELLVVEGAGHWPHREDQQRFDAALLAFLGRATAVG